MLDIKWIRENPDALDRALANRRAEPAAKRLIALDEERRAAVGKAQAAQERRNAASKEIGKAKAARDEAGAAALMAEVAGLKTAFAAAEEEERRLEKALRDELAIIPNVPQEDVPVGDEAANIETHRWGAMPGSAGSGRRTSRPDWPIGFKPREHFDLGEAMRLMDFEAAAKLSGSRFVVLKGGLARLERALGQFMLDLHTGEHRYTEVAPPLLVKDKALLGTAQLPKFELDQFEVLTELLRLKFAFEYTEGTFFTRGSAYKRLDEVYRLLETDRRSAEESGKDVSWSSPSFWMLSDVFKEFTREFKHDSKAFTDLKAEFARLEESNESRLFLIPTAEVPLTNLVRGSILAEAELPLRYTALTPCFRSEAGAAGRDTRGMLRQHQFNKVELVSITTPDQSRAEHERMLASAEEVLKRLDLHFRVVTLSTGDMGFAAQKTWDIEVWLPGQGAFREISSCSNCGDFQARRMEARYRPKDGKGTRHVHTLNGSGVAVGRALIAVMETYQNADGSVTVPSALAPYMAGIERIEA